MYDLRCLPIPTVGWEENSLGTYKKYKGLLGAFNKSWKNLEIHIHLNFKPLESVLILNSTDRTVQVYLYMLSIYWSWSSKLILFSVKLFFCKNSFKNPSPNVLLKHDNSQYHTLHKFSALQFLFWDWSFCYLFFHSIRTTIMLWHRSTVLYSCGLSKYLCF